LRIKEQESRLTLQEHDYDDDDDFLLWCGGFPDDEWILLVAKIVRAVMLKLLK